MAETAGSTGSGGRVAGVRRELRGTVTEDGPRHRDAENVTLPPGLFRRCNHVTMVSGPYRGPNARSAFSTLDSGPRRAGECDVPGIFVTDRASPASLSGTRVTEVRLRVVPAPVPHEPLTSRASRGGHSLPGPPRDARDATRTCGRSERSQNSALSADKCELTGVRRPCRPSELRPGRLVAARAGCGRHETPGT